MGISGLETFLFNVFYEQFFEFTDEFNDETDDEFTEHFGDEYDFEFIDNTERNDESIEQLTNYESADESSCGSSDESYSEEVIYEPNDLSLPQSPDELKSPFVLRELKDLRLIVDGNQLPYHISHIIKSNEYGGNYDQIYEKIKEIFQILKPYIEVVIFDGSKEDLTKSVHRFKKNINDSLQTNSNSNLDDLKKTPPFFFRMIMYKVLRELDILHLMADGMADHAVACYANGFNDRGVYGTVLSMDSHFYAYNLKNGYLSFKYFSTVLNDLNNLNGSTNVPVFYVGRLIKIIEFRNYRTWLYFCILLGDYFFYILFISIIYKAHEILLGDYDLKLAKNKTFMKTHCLENKTDLLDHMKKEECSLIQNGYKQIRSSYSHNYNLLRLIDELIANFEFKNNKYNIEHSSHDLKKFDDFNRIILTMKDLNSIFLYCIIEDTNQKHVYQLCQHHHILQHIYKLVNCRVFTEYSRTNNTSFDSCINVTVYSEKRIMPNQILDYINRLEFDRHNIDDMKLFMVSVSVWYDWICKKNFIWKHFQQDNIDIVEILFNNFIILKLKKIIIDDENYCIHTGQDYYGELLRDGLRTNLHEYVKVIELYDSISDPSRHTKSNHEYFQKDLLFVHSINEFQSFYYMIGVYCKLKSINNLKWLSPDEFLNGLFLCKCLQEFESIGTESYVLRNLMKKNDRISHVTNEMLSEFHQCLNGIPSLVYSKSYDWTDDEEDFS